MGKLYWCINCEENNIHDRQRHHYEKHLQMPYNDNFFKPVCEYKNITKIKCLLCGYIVESDQYKKRMKIHAQIFHPQTKKTDVFDPTKALRAMAFKCSICKRFVEKDRLTKTPTCPHGSLYDDPNESPGKTENGRPNENRKRDANNDISEREIKISKECDGTEATSTTIERESSNAQFTICKICHNNVEWRFLPRHMKRKHSARLMDTYNPMSLTAETENGGLNDTRKRDTNNKISEREFMIFKGSVGMEATSTTVEREPSDVEYTGCNVCRKRIKTNDLETHMRRKHLEKPIVLDSDSDRDEKPKIKIEKDAGHSTVTTTDSDSDEDDKPRIKVEKNAEHNTVATSKPIPKEIPSNESHERPNQEPSDSETEFYPLRISKSELERFLLAKRIYPKNGNFYLKDA